MLAALRRWKNAFRRFTTPADAHRCGWDEKTPTVTISGRRMPEGPRSCKNAANHWRWDGHALGCAGLWQGPAAGALGECHDQPDPPVMHAGVVSEVKQADAANRQAEAEALQARRRWLRACGCRRGPWGNRHPISCRHQICGREVKGRGNETGQGGELGSPTPSGLGSLRASAWMRRAPLRYESRPSGTVTRRLPAEPNDDGPYDANLNTSSAQALPAREDRGFRACALSASSGSVGKLERTRIGTGSQQPGATTQTFRRRLLK